MSKNKNDDLGDKQKDFEGIEAQRKLMPMLPSIARIDGRKFSKFTQGLDRPFDINLSEAMIATTAYLVEQSNARCGYTQSDEISLVWYEPSGNKKMYFAGRIQKIVSALTSEATIFFYRHILKNLPEKYANRLPRFDCRLWNLPTLEEAVNALLWRELDSTKNSVSMAARHYFLPPELKNKKSNEMQEMLWSQHNVNFNDYPSFFKRGTFLRRKTFQKKFDAALDDLPEKHNARNNPDFYFERSEIVRLEMPPFSKVINKVDVIFNSADPIVV